MRTIKSGRSFKVIVLCVEWWWWMLNDLACFYNQRGWNQRPFSTLFQDCDNNYVYAEQQRSISSESYIQQLKCKALLFHGATINPKKNCYHPSIGTFLRVTFRSFQLSNYRINNPLSLPPWSIMVPLYKQTNYIMRVMHATAVYIALLFTYKLLIKHLFSLFVFISTTKDTILSWIAPVHK